MSRRGLVAIAAAVAILSTVGATSSSLASPHAQVGVGGPPITSVDGTAPADGTATTTAFATGPVPAAGSVTTTVLVSAGPTTVPAVPAATTTMIEATTVPAIVPTNLVLTTLTPTTLIPKGTTRAPATSSAELRVRVDAALAKSSAASLGVLVIIDGGASLYERNPDVGLVPASTQKIYVAGAALDLLGADARYRTEVLTNGSIGGSVLRGDLIVRPSGDPSFGSSQLGALAISVRAAGITSVTGSLVLDDGHYDRTVRVASWKAKFSPGESGWLSAFAVDGNHRIDAATVADPGLANLARFRLALVAKGVVVIGPDVRGAAGAAAVGVASVTSAPVADLVASFVKRSDNTYAELMTKELGARTGTGSTVDGVRAIGSYFDRLAVTRPQVQEDGSGLSSNNRSSARVQVRFLQRALAGPNGSTLRRSFAISCVDGTLKSRTCGTQAAGKVFAKSGSIDNVVALTGVTATDSGRPVTFSFLLNGVRSARLGRAAIDEALAEIVASRV